MNKARVTIPTERGFQEETQRIAKLWGADAVRDCDGTELPENVAELAEKVYNTYFIVRGDNDWAQAHPNEAHRAFLLSEKTVARESSFSIPVMKGFFREQVSPDWENVSYWEVVDRTTGELHEDWKPCAKSGTVILQNARLYHEYTVSFLARIEWHPVQIYNYLTNGWTCPKQKMYDPAYSATAEYVLDRLNQWCKEHPETNVVRFTTFLYQFMLIYNEDGKEKYVDWFGYGMAASPALMEAFAKEYGYRLRAEDFVDGGCYNNPFRVPSKRFLDYMQFIEKQVSQKVARYTKIVHSYGKEAMMFLGDDWIGAEPYGEYFADMGLDAVVGSVGGGVTVRMLSEIPHVKYREGRLLPYFFSDTFFERNEKNAVAELERNWRTARRAMLRKPLDRIGFGGYLSLAAQFPEFVERTAQVCDEFRSIYNVANGEKAYCGLKAGVLNCWGKKRSWMSHMVAHELWYRQISSYQGVLEALSGLPVDVCFLSFDEILKGGIPEDLDVMINVGDADTSYSGGEYWNNEELLVLVRRWVDEGHGFIGIGEPTAYRKNGGTFALADVFGVDKERGFTLGTDRYNAKAAADHFIMQDAVLPIDYGKGTSDIYALDGAQILDIVFPENAPRLLNSGEIKCAVNDFGKGRAVYFAGLPYSVQNARLLHRALFWVAGKESEFYRAYSSHIDTECSYYPKKKTYAIVNNGTKNCKTDLYNIAGFSRRITVKAGEIKWIKDR